jgi:hydroxypyruvate isomerase
MFRTTELAMPDNALSRRDWIQTAALAGVAMTAQTSAQADPPAARKGRIRQSLVQWCYDGHWPNFEDLCRVAVELGVKSIELGDTKHWPMLKKYGLTSAIAGSHGFTKGFNNRNEWDECIAALKTNIDQCVDFGCERIITFTGMANGIDKAEGADNCVEGLKKIVGYAEQKKVTICLEMLNSRDDSHPMKGHLGYQGDHCDYCIDILKRVGSPRLKLLFDIYHVQIMDGDVIRRIRQHKEWLGHIHTAGNPGRGELDEKQEISYPAIMNALLEVGYEGYVAQEFIPTRDPLAGLQQAVALCDV